MMMHFFSQKDVEAHLHITNIFVKSILYHRNVTLYLIVAILCLTIANLSHANASLHLTNAILCLKIVTLYLADITWNLPIAVSCQCCCLSCKCDFISHKCNFISNNSNCMTLYLIDVIFSYHNCSFVSCNFIISLNCYLFYLYCYFMSHKGNFTSSLSPRCLAHGPLAKHLMHMSHLTGNTSVVLKSSSDWLDYTGFPEDVCIL